MMNLSRLFIFGTLALLLIAGCAKTDGVVVARNGKSDYRIVIAENASFSTVHAAGELQKFIHEMSGAQIPVVSDLENTGDHDIILGRSSHLDALGLDIDLDAVGDEGFVLRTVGRHIVIAGGDLRGNLYGTYELLERLGCRWFTNEVSRIPTVKKLVVPLLDVRIIPPLEYREAFVYEAFSGDWAARNRMNRNGDGSLSERHGGAVKWVPGYFVHTFAALVPPDRYFASHPEYFSLVNGKRLKDRSQLCCTNDDVVEIVTRGVLKALGEHPEATVISLSQNDWYNYCECEKCQALAEREGSQIAPVLQLVNRVADAVAERYPDKAVETLAYQWTRTPPATMRPRNNVIVRLCSIECCFSHPLAECDSPESRAFVDDLRNWAQVSDRLWVWNYVTSFAHYLAPFPNLHVRNDNIRLFVDNSVTGIFQQDVYQTPNGELSALSGWLNARFLWDPDYDEDTAINEFLDGVYGEAAPSIRAYIDMLRDKVERENVHAHIWDGPDALYLTDDILARADSLWNEAESQVAGSPDVLDRVRVARLSVDYAHLGRALGDGVYLIDHDRLRVDVNPSFNERLDRFCRIAEEARITHLNESGLTVAAFREQVKSQIMPRQLVYLEPVANAGLKPGINRSEYDIHVTDMPDFSALKPVDTEPVTEVALPDHEEGDIFALRFTGFITVPADGVYSFSVVSDDGAYLYIGDELIVDNGGNHPAQERSGFAALKTGTYPVRLIYYNSAGNAALNLYYRAPGGEKQTVTADMLFHK